MYMCLCVFLCVLRMCYTHLNIKYSIYIHNTYTMNIKFIVDLY